MIQPISSLEVPQEEEQLRERRQQLHQRLGLARPNYTQMSMPLPGRSAVR
jgi:hypothetical protein